MNDHRSPAYEPALDGLRAWAVTAVVLYHASVTSRLNVQTGGFIGVSVFFTLSGFLVTRMLLAEHQANAAIDLRRFWSRRIRRLAPASLTVIALVVLLASREWPGMQPSDAAAGIWGYTNWHVIASGEAQLLRTIVGPLGPFWSLAVEEQFYLLLVIAFAIAALTRRPAATLAAVLSAGWLVSAVVQLAVSSPAYRAEFGTERRMAELLAGCLLALALQHRPSILTTNANAWGLAALPALAALIGYGIFGSSDPGWLLHGGYVAVGIVSVVVILGVLSHGHLARLLSVRPIVKVGVMSYSIYLVHWPVVLMIDHHFAHAGRWPSLISKVVVSFAAATALHLLVEQPLRRARMTPRLTGALWIGTCLSVTVAAGMLLG